ncbi:MAG: biotin--[acetyl-CoA-carboxylase] ligase [Treponema sp.]|jgi:BirA family biotin operon repressor/biotin-[acetyl-CoA-carboxylase] ligase|nr:biotin--[acetyl-CoA-carboxylase] ligase [Treponema sp.]
MGETVLSQHDAMKTYSTKAHLLSLLREKQGEAASGNVLAKEIGVSRVAVWKTVQTLLDAGYAIQTGENGYLLNPEDEKDFLYPWEFGEKENLFFHYQDTSSTMDRAREMALRGTAGGSVFAAEKQSAGRGRIGRSWVSQAGGLFFSILERPSLTVADYTQLSMITQIAAVRVITKVCGKPAHLRWPNDVYIDNRKIAGISTEVLGEGDRISWLTLGIGVNVNNPAPSNKAASCAEILGHSVSRREVLNAILDEIQTVKKTFYQDDKSSEKLCLHGNKPLAAEWNSYSDCIGAKTSVFEPEHKSVNHSIDNQGRILVQGIFSGIDPTGKCMLKAEDQSNKMLLFNQGSVSLVFTHS